MSRPQVPVFRRLHGAGALAVVMVLTLCVGCATIAGLSAAGEALQEAGYEVHDLLMEEGGSVYADLERPDGATDVEHFEEAGAIIWDHLDDEAQQVEIRLRSPETTDEIVTYSATQLQQMNRADNGT